ncbi:hypothetical protein [Flavobacterium solisilvae]|uniref:HEPN domain-containing protein n=1 Tax=Flavobacterium solisilvae TaxID=1852019 RepID=A0ABX1QSK3_9FLAO|nr:hypothetical protein [Flavobacterium solisilvae]NMH24053.1 hypothetical protein [Flavobacterium solisilvae]
MYTELKIRDKSDNNIDAAELLIAKGLHSSSVHCSYYGSFQRIMYSLKNHLGISYSDLDNMCKGKDSHIFLIRLCCDEFKKKGKTAREANDLDRDLNDLKILRKKSDYKDEIIVPDDSDEALRISNRVIRLLKSTFLP